MLNTFYNRQSGTSRLLFLSTFVVACIVATLLLCSASVKSSTATAAVPKQFTEVATATIKQHPVQREKAFPGRVSAARQAVVRPQVDGIITQRFFEGGTYIEKGQQLYQIDDTRYQAVLNSRLADLESAEADFLFTSSRVQRYKNLMVTNAVSKEDYEDVKANFARAKAAVSVAQAAVDLAKVDLDYTKVYAPISGYISRSLVTEGTLVSANQVQELSVITQLDPIYVDLQHSGAGLEILALAERIASNSLSVNLQLESQSKRVNYDHAGQLILSEVTVDESTGATALRALVPNPEGVLRPGMFVRAQVQLDSQNALLVPQRAATRTATGELQVWTVDKEHKAQRQTIEVQSAYRDSWIVQAGLSEGQQIIIEGYQKVVAGEQVNTVPASGDMLSKQPGPENQSVAMNQR